MAEIHNGRCHPEKAPMDPPPLIQNGKVSLQYHHIGWIASSALTLVAMGVSFWLIGKHLQWYTNKHEQRYIVRILFMVPLYAVISTASYFWWNHSTPLILLRDGYESTVLTAFFYLLLLYLSPDTHEQKEIFRKKGLSRENDRERRRRGDPVQKWMWPMGFVRWKPADGLYFLQLMKWGVLQYCVVRPGTTLAAVILDYMGLYCEESWSLGWGHVYIILVVSISVTIGMYCLIQLYMVVSEELAPHRPLLKLFAIKAVVFLTFWQATFLSVLAMFGFVKDTPYMTAGNINIGIGALLETFEMAIFACLHVKAFSYKPYCTGDQPTPRWRALVHAMNFKETGRELWEGIVYMVRKYRGREVDTQARREAALENVFGRSRFAITREANSSGSKVNVSEKDAGVTVEVEKEVHVGDERQWLGLGDDYIYGLGYQAKRQRERSEGLESQIEKELARRGYSLRGGPASGGAYAPIVDAEAAPAPAHQRGQASWWRRIYNRLSQSGPDTDTDGTSSPPTTFPHTRRRSSSRRRSKDITGKVGTAPLMADVQEDDYNDPPPPSAIRTYRESRNNGKSRKNGPKRQSPPTLDPPLLFTSSPEARNDTRYPILPAPQPAMLSPPLLSPSAHFLDRAFSGSVEPGSSVESHHHHVRLGSVPAVDTKVTAQPKTPVVVDAPIPSPSTSGPSRSPPFAPMPEPVIPFVTPLPPAPLPPPVAMSPDRNAPPMWAPEESRGRRRSSHRRDSARFYPEPRNFSPPHEAQSPPRSPLRSLPQSPTLQRATAGYSRGTRRNSGTQQYQPQNAQPYTPLNRYTPTRDRIVLPAPLASASGPSNRPAPSAPDPALRTFSPPGYMPSGLPPSPPSRERRWTGPQSPPYSNGPR
ncbi:organic solute transporter Ostalpha-domain-containing protein [Earliella scabrosa]|nr:organic solute transporter Ostalpha-domain-containing protein [Earliella scabrosa]